MALFASGLWSVNVCLDPSHPLVVGWAGDDDPENPRNWPLWRINVNAGLLTFLAFLIPLGSTIIAPGVPQIMEGFQNSSPELAAFVLSIFIFATAFGPLFFSPLSEIYGRLIMYHIANVGFVASNVACALSPTLESLIFFRFLAGFFGSCPITNGAASIADMAPPETRGKFMGAFAVGPLLGPVIGPAIAGFVNEALGWRWVFWVVSAASAATTVIVFLFCRETYAPVLLQRRVRRLRESTGNPMLRHMLDDGLTPWDQIRRAIVRPLKLLFLSPIGFISALYLAIVYGYLYIMFSTMPAVFARQYHITGSIAGLTYLGLGVGSLLGVMTFSLFSNHAIKKIASDGKELKPEVRFRIAPLGALALPVGLFLYGWSADRGAHWIVPIIGMAVVGIANVVLFMSICLYLVDCFELYSASALAANTVMRSIGAGLLPLVGVRMIDTLGIGWGHSLMGFIAVAMIPIPFLFLRFGEFLRRRFEFTSL
ncbi:major facilitator superfamily domain-containing protein [Plectosphaerella plurivora]|uniref:Major facilitator superfamily domain-containing protein n=1 Tax=Plectosphaerella plurivora TaxID=936078 RepID=A0A9P8VGF1_9PEZI|nr:major facilitator superfamily domain-containing protein [Plectosphaerella plurivora]